MLMQAHITFLHRLTFVKLLFPPLLYRNIIIATTFILTIRALLFMVTCAMFFTFLLNYSTYNLVLSLVTVTSILCSPTASALGLRPRLADLSHCGWYCKAYVNKMLPDLFSCITAKVKWCVEIESPSQISLNKLMWIRLDELNCFILPPGHRIRWKWCNKKRT